MPQNCWNLFHLWNFQEYRLHIKTKIPVDWKIQNWGFCCNVEVITAKDPPQKRNFANGKKSFGFMVWKEWLSWPCSSWGLFSLRVKDCVEADISISSNISPYRDYPFCEQISVFWELVERYFQSTLFVNLLCTLWTQQFRGRFSY